MEGALSVIQETFTLRRKQYILHHVEKEVSRDYFRQNRGGNDSSDKSYRQGGARPRSTNPLNRDGTMSKCAICESIFHWVKDCLDADKSERVNVASHEKEESNERLGTSEPSNLKEDENVTAVTTKELCQNLLTLQS